MSDIKATKAYTNPCTRCGKERIFYKSHTIYTKSLLGNNTFETVYTETICPDPECQAIVDKELAAKREKREAVQKEKDKRIQDTADKKIADKKAKAKAMV